LASPVWSPNGKYIAFKCQPSGIWVMDADGANARRLTVMTGDTSPVWAPDGSKLAFIHGVMTGDVGIFMITADGKGIRKYLYDCQIEDQDTPDRVLNLAWSHFLNLDAESRKEKADFEIPTELTPHAEIGVFYDRHGQYEEALQEFEAAHELNKEDADILVELAKSHLTMSQNQRAVDTAERALNMLPTPYRRFMARSVTAVGYAQLQQTDKAIEECEIFLSLATRRQDKAVVHSTLASVWGQYGNPLLAQKHLQKAYELSPNIDGIRKELGIIQSLVGQNADMINRQKEEENPLKLQFLEAIAGGMMLVIANKEEDAYQREVQNTTS
jgi:tetratricopeptide (TPR) repeat protein